MPLCWVEGLLITPQTPLIASRWRWTFINTILSFSWSNICMEIASKMFWTLLFSWEMFLTWCTFVSMELKICMFTQCTNMTYSTEITPMSFLDFSRTSLETFWQSIRCMEKSLNMLNKMKHNWCIMNMGGSPE
jgi:hypothetical protein